MSGGAGEVSAPLYSAVAFATFPGKLPQQKEN